MENVLFKKALEELAAYYQSLIDPSHRTGIDNFHCSVQTVSNSPPVSVHTLRPGDINVIAALGDSITVSNRFHNSLCGRQRKN